jgi:sphingomyelin phosphodiesterase
VSPDIAKLFQRKQSVYELQEQLRRRRQAPDQQAASDTIRILHITDLHVDPQYLNGSDSNCLTYLCCHGIYGPGDAGQYGTNNCDMSPRVLQSFFRYINLTFAYTGNPFVTNATALNGHLDYVLWGGDNPAQDMWNASVGRNLGATQFIATALRNNLPGLPVFPAPGTHDFLPDNLFNPATDLWMLDALADAYLPWLDSTMLSTFRQLGAYTALLRPGLRVLVANTQFASARNFYLIMDSMQNASLAHQTFIVATLEQARAAKEKVIYLSHVPPGTLDSTPTFGARAAQMATLYKDVILFSAFGHDHHDLFQVFHQVSPDLAMRPLLDQPLSVAFVAPSMTPYNAVNPAFRVYTLNATTFELIDHETHFFNLTQANLWADDVAHTTDSLLEATALASWHKLYNMKETYNMTDMSALSFANLSQRILHEAPVANLFATLAHVGKANVQCAPDSCGVAFYCLTQFASLSYYYGCIMGMSNTTTSTTPSAATAAAGHP